MKEGGGRGGDGGREGEGWREGEGGRRGVTYAYGVFGTTGQVVPTSGQVVETTCECSVVSTTDFYQLSGSVQLQI